MRHRLTLSFAFTFALCAPGIRSQESRPSVTSWEQELERAVALFAGGDPEGAITAGRAALELAETFGPEDERVAKSLLSLSSLLIVQGQYEEAEALSRRAHRISEKILQDARVRVATTLKYLGAIYTQQDKLAEEVYLRAVEVSEEGVLIIPRPPSTSATSPLRTSVADGPGRHRPCCCTPSRSGPPSPNRIRCTRSVR